LSNQLCRGFLLFDAMIDLMSTIFWGLAHGHEIRVYVTGLMHPLRVAY
jgi:hypothetical protein